MKERPILFSEPMVKAILAGKKTQTRRLADLVLDGETTGDGYTTMGPTRGWGRAKPGWRLWVRETFSIEELDEGERVVWSADRQAHWLNSVSNPFYLDSAYEPARWRPSIHMPRWASRIDLEITSLRCERLQDITEEDARAEGVGPRGDGPAAHRAAFHVLWNEINGDRAPWASNPWVWAISFKRVKA